MLILPIGAMIRRRDMPWCVKMANALLVKLWLESWVDKCGNAVSYDD
jgi:hypothetical protein